MIHLANIMIATDDADLGDDLVKKLQRHQYHARVLASQPDVLAEAEQEHPDILLLGASLKGGDPMTLTRILKASPATAEIPICLVGGEPSAELQARALSSGVADVLIPPISENKLIARLRPLVRLAAMQVELQQRGVAAKNFGLPETPLPLRRKSDLEERILLIGHDVEQIGKHLPGAQLSTVADPFQAELELEHKSFDAAIAKINGDPLPYLDLCVQTRNNPRLFNLPLILIADPDSLSEEAAYQHGVSGYFAEPADPFKLNSAAMFLVHRQRLRWAVREALIEAAKPAIKDPATGLFSRAFLDSYLPIRIAHAHKLSRPLSIAFFRVPEVEHIRQRFGEEQANHLRLQVSQWITRLLRTEDLTALYQDNEFCVVLPDSPQKEADLVINRIAGVLAYTDFAVREVYEPVKVWVRVGSAELQEGETPKMLVTRARQAMAE